MTVVRIAFKDETVPSGSKAVVPHLGRGLRVQLVCTRRCTQTCIEDGQVLREVGTHQAGGSLPSGSAHFPGEQPLHSGRRWNVISLPLWSPPFHGKYMCATPVFVHEGRTTYGNKTRPQPQGLTYAKALLSAK